MKSDFINVLKKYGSGASSSINTSVLNGITGMPVTHQTGFGYYWRRGIHPDDVDMKQLNKVIHERMGLAGIGSIGGISIVSNSPNILLKIIGGIVTVASYRECHELYLDWKAGFAAAKHIGPWYKDYISQKTRTLQWKPI